jgi:DnaJ-class molecular chaperone
MALMYCETCGISVQPCGWCRGAGVIVGNVKLGQTEVGEAQMRCPGCGGTGKFCKHTAKIDDALREKLLAIKSRIA